jgi:hypothetical protein
MNVTLWKLPRGPSQPLAKIKVSQVSGEVKIMLIEEHRKDTGCA